MTLIQSVFLGAVQGLTEFLPVSSSGHLALFQHFFSFQTPPIFFDTIAHLGTLLAVVFYLRKEIIYIFKNLKKDIKNISWFDSLFIGVFQAFAILPGISMSGSTISASIFRSLKRDDAFKFSFLMSIPVIFGAFLLQFTEQNFNLFNGGVLTNLTGFLFSAVFGFLSLKIIEKVLIKGKLHYFAAYCFVLGVLILIFM